MVGNTGEDAAVAVVRAAGYKVVERNYRCRSGEIDLVCRDGRELVFVEVKYRRSTACGSPLAAVTPRKQQHITEAALHYIRERRCERCPIRFDVVAIGPAGTNPEIVRQAFTAAGEYTW